jgi:hypothetical protein
MDSAVKNQIGKKFTFDDGRTLKIIQVKYRDLGEGAAPYVTYETDYPGSFPKRSVLAESQFISTFGHLFFDNNKNDNNNN